MRRLITVAAAVLTAAGAAAVAPHAHAETVPSDPPDPPSASSMLAALGRHYGLTPEQADIRLSREKWGATTSAELKRRLGPVVAGSWMTNGGQTLNVAISDPAKADVVLAAGAVPKTVTRSWATLQDVKKRLDAAKRPAGIVDWSIDPATNTVVVRAEPGTESSVRRWLETLVPSAAVRVDTSDERPRLMAGVLRGGTSIFTEGKCSMGFAVDDGILTAGHCGKVGDEVTDGDGSRIGRVKSREKSFEGDFAFIETEPVWELTSEVWMFDGSKTVDVRGSQEAPIGASVCRSGDTTGWHCGTILMKDVTASYNDGTTIGGLTRTDVCSEPGDSGGPVIAGDQAQGVLSGGNGNCTAGGTSIFQPVNEILTKYNLKLF